MVLMTGATGLVGAALLDELLREGESVVSAVRDSRSGREAGSGLPTIPFDLERPHALDAGSLRGFDCVYHLAARVHVMGGGDDDRFTAMNVRATEILAAAARDAGVRRFVYVSSVKVNGERTSAKPFSSTDVPAPQDAYGRSKRDAESVLARIAAGGDMEVVVVRPPLVYGPGVGANFRRLMSIAARGWPLPLAAVDNRRSLVSVWNLASLLSLARHHPNAPGRPWLVSDGRDVSTPQLLRSISAAMGRNARLWSLPPWTLRAAGRVLGYGEIIERLVDSLQIDMTDTCERLQWRPPVSFDEGIGRTASWFMESADALV